jgi:signal transduction histidine kinase
MVKTTWWTVAVVGVAGALSVLMIANGAGGWRLGAALVAVAAFVLAWFTNGRRAIATDSVARGYVVTIIVLVGAACFLDLSLASLQAVAYPLIWMVLPTVREAIVGNVGLAGSVGVAFFLHSGPSAESASEALLVAGLSLTFALAMGLWITHIWTLSDSRQRLVEELQAAQSSLAALNRDAGITSERERLAREIHDTIAQDLTALVLLSEQSRRLLTGGDTSGAQAQLALLEENARLALAETRALVATTSPASLDAGLPSALERLADRFARETGITTTVSTTGTAPLDRPTEVVLLRCTQEGLANVRRHSRAHAASITLVSTRDAVTLTIGDDGRGFDTSAPSDGFGLGGMRDRLALVDGSLEVASGGQGTRLVVTLPGRCTDGPPPTAEADPACLEGAQ